MKDKSKIYIFIDDETEPIGKFVAPVHFELDTQKLVDGPHKMRIVSKGPDGKEGVRIIPFEVKNGPHISIEGLQSNETVDGTLPIMINAYSKGDSNKFYIEGAETPQSIPILFWILIIGFVGWALYYFITYISMPAGI